MSEDGQHKTSSVSYTHLDVYKRQNQLGEEDTETMFRVLGRLAEIMEQSVDQDTK